MRSFLISLAVLCFAGTVGRGEIYAISYIESSTGLIPPTMEGGRTEVEMGDVDSDGNIDLVSIGDHGSPYINTDQHGIMVWFGDGTGSWSVYQYGNFGYGGVALGDVDNDGKMDVGYGMHHDYSSTDLGDQLLEVALGDGSGKFWTPWDDGLATNGETWGMFCTDFADIDNDGDLDIGSNSFGSGAGVHVYLNNGDGTWTQSFGFTGGNSTMDFRFGDVNGDGNQDFAVAHQFATVYIGDGAGGFTVGDGNLPSPGNIGHYGPDLGDTDSDGRDELSYCNSDGGIEVWSLVDTNTWVDVSGTLPSSGPYDATQLCDMDVDGNVDVVGFGGGTVTIWKGDGAGGWTQIVSFSTYSPGYYQAFRVGGDADHNGYPDIALVEKEGSWPNDQNHARFYKEESLPDSLGIKPVYPRGFERFYGGSVRFIRWITAVPGSAAVIRLELSTTGTSGPWTLIADSLKDNGRHQWTVVNYVNSDNCYIRYAVFSERGSATCMTPAPFEIISPSTVPHDREYSRVPGLSMSVFPNPARRSISISYSIPNEKRATLKIYDLAGGLIRTVVEGDREPGTYLESWDGKTPDGREAKAGTYFFRLRTGSVELTKKAVLIGH
ncbi:MAG: FG-GAP-like repeat-containing protein [bacterium]